jgi:hypothetical protein
MNYFLEPPTKPQPVTAGISFGDLLFSEPELVPSLCPPSDYLFEKPGIYAIMALTLEWRPRSYRPIYFGESQNVRRRATTSHENNEKWQREAGSILYRAFYEMPGSTQMQRQAVESMLIARYSTPCNHKLSLDLLSALLGSRKA